MSKLLDKLERVSRDEAQPMGFRSKGALSKGQSMLLIIALPQINAGALTEALKLDADALLIYAGEKLSEGEEFQKIIKAMGDMPWGIWSREITQEQVERLVEMGCDLVAFEALRTPASLLQQEKLGKVIRVSPLPDEGLLETLEQLPVDAILIEDDEGLFPSIHHLMVCQRLVNLVSKPLLSMLPTGATHADIRSLWEVGVDGVVVKMGKDYSGEQFLKLRKATREMTVTMKRRGRGKRVLLPPLSPSSSKEE